MNLKKLIILATIFMFQFYGTAQNRYGEVTFSGGASYNMLRVALKIPYAKYESKFDFTLGQQFHLDWALFRRLSIGIGGTHQKQVLNVSNYQYFDGPAIITENIIETTDVFAGYLRVLLHILPVYENTNSKVDTYWGVQQGVIYYGSSSNSLDPNAPAGAIINPFMIAIVGGIRYYPYENLGLYFESAIPGAYTFSAGIQLRAFGRDRLVRKGKIKSIFLP